MELEVNCRITHYVPESDRTPLLYVSAITLLASSNVADEISRQVMENITTAVVARFGFLQ
jgi:hypothetical protein